MGRRTAISILLVAALQAGGTPAGAQSFRGRLIDATTSQPVSGGVVSLLQPNGVVLSTVMTPASGRFSLSAPGPGQYRLVITRLGYSRLQTGPFTLGAGDQREQDFLISPMAVQLPEIGVTAPAPAVEPSPYLTRVGFYERQKSDFGHFVTEDEIVARQARRFTDLLTVIPGVTILPADGGLGRASVQLRGSPLGGTCHPRVFIDGLMVIRGDARPRGLTREGLPEQRTTERFLVEPERSEIALDDVVMPDDVQAIEVYRSGAQTPVQFGGTSTWTQCGVIVVWTRQGRR